jgi:hypothetical protein
MSYEGFEESGGYASPLCWCMVFFVLFAERSVSMYAARFSCVQQDYLTNNVQSIFRWFAGGDLWDSKGYKYAHAYRETCEVRRFGK